MDRPKAICPFNFFQSLGHKNNLNEKLMARLPVHAKLWIFILSRHRQQISSALYIFMFFCSVYCKHYNPRSDCSHGSSLIRVNSFCFHVCFACFVALRPKSTAMVIAERSVHLTTLFSWASLNKQFTSNRAHTLACYWQQPFMNDSAEGRRMTVEIISWSISTKVWDLAGSNSRPLDLQSASYL